MSSDLNLSRGPPPIPRSILKNRDRDVSRFGSQDSMISDDRQSNNMINPGAAAWMNSSGNMVAPGGVNPSSGNPSALGIGTDVGLERSLRHKLNEFISRKAEMLFKPLTSDEMPLAEVKGTQHNSEDHYGVVPSLDHYLRVDTSEIRRYFFQNLQVGDVLIASVASRNNSGLFLKLMSTEGGKHIVLEDLGIKSFCPLSQTIPAGDPRDTNRSFEFANGDIVRVEALEVSADTEKLVCGMKGVTLSPEMQHSFHLGLIHRHELPRQFTLAKADGESRNRKTYEEMLLTSSGFHNPNNISHLATTMGILSDRNSLMAGLRGVFPAKENASHLRRIQNAKWAHGNVAEGIKYFKMEKFTEAFQCLNKALSIDAENVEGLVARGALYANNGGFEKAIDDFESALKFNPNHFNARKYLAETLVALGRQQEETGKLEDAVASYSKCLVVKPDHKDAKTALWSLFERTNKLDVTKLAPPAAIKASELKEKLKAILQTELGMKIDGKGGKEKKSKRKKGRKTSSGSDDDSSTSSTSESDSDSSSSEESDRGKRKKKNKKKKSKKSKKVRKSRDESKTRALSLSPFSKKLVDPQGAAGSGLAGFSESTFAEWGQQLGISKPEKKDDSDDESKKSGKKSKDKKRSKKKEKRKKRRRATSSSSTSESDSSKEKEKKKSKNASGIASQNTSIEGIIPDLGDLEAKLSAYYSKIEQEKIEPVIPPEAVKITVERSSSNNRSRHPRDAYNEPVRKIEVKPKLEENLERHHQQKPSAGGWNEAKQLGKIELRTDDYGNYIQPENIVRTFHNDTSAVSEPKPIKFEMKFKNLNAPNTAPTQTEAQSQSELGSKWRPLGSAPPPSANTEDVKEVSPTKPAIKNPFEVQKFDGKGGKEHDRNYRNQKASRSPSPRSRDRRRKRSYSRSRSNSSSSDSRSKSRSKSRSRSPYRGDRSRRNPRFDRDRRDLRDSRDFRGRPPVRFFRGFNRSMRRPYVPRGRYRPNGPSRSKFRNRFSNSMSRSRSRSRSRRSPSRSLLSRSRSKSTERNPRDRRGSTDKDRERKDHSSITKDHKPKETPEKKDEPSKVDPKTVDEKSAVVVEEIQIGSLTTTKASDVEELLDKRNAEKKEELRKSNPDFFRN